MYYEDCDHIYHVDNKKVVMDYSKKELEVANWLKDTFNEKVIMLPKVNWPEHIQTPDYIFRGEKWDLKELKNIDSKRAIDNLINQAKKLFLNPYRKWVNKIIIKRNNKLIDIYVRK